MVSAVLVIFLLSSPTWADQTASSISKNVKSSLGEDDCSALQPGQRRVVNEDDDVSPTGVERHYVIQRDEKDPHRYNVQFNAQFLFASEAMRGYGKSTREELNQMMVKKVNQCFQKNEKRLSDKNGDFLHVTFLSDPNDRSVPYRPIIVGAAGGRSDDEVWSADAECPTLIHETMHLTGLVDEYRETGLRSRNGGGMYDCRHVPKTNTIMKSHQALEDHVSVTLCTCNKGSCQNAPTRMLSGQTGCPPGYQAQSTTPMSEAAAIQQVASMADVPGFVLLVQNQGGNGHALSPNQTALLQKPRCRDGMYIKCSQNAYRTRSEQGCLDTPISCAAGDW